MAGSTGIVILLTGPSCAGKSTLAKAIQSASAEPLLVQSLDGLFAVTPEEWGGSGRHALDGFRYEWLAQPGVRRIAYGPVGWGLLQGFHRAVAAFAACGVSVVVDDMLLDLEVLHDWALALEGLPVLLVSVTAPKAELLQRERDRTLHPTPGLVEGHFDLHRGVVADIQIDTSTLSPSEAARALLDLVDPPRRFRALHAYRRP